MMILYIFYVYIGMPSTIDQRRNEKLVETEKEKEKILLMFPK